VESGSGSGSPAAKAAAGSTISAMAGCWVRGDRARIGREEEGKEGEDFPVASSLITRRSGGD
jgi:hypothetical protein